MPRRRAPAEPVPFCAFILTHGRPDAVITERTLRTHGYTGPVYLVVDDEDRTLDAYRARFGADHVLTFSKAEIARTFDEGDNFRDRRAIVYARNATWAFARRLGVEAFVQLDDDYSGFYYRFDPERRYGNWKGAPLDALFPALVAYLRAAPALLSVALSQGGDHVGGAASGNKITARRKAMNTFVCLTERPFQFVGRINEDVNTYVALQRRGAGAFLTFNAAQVNQRATQSVAGGMTDLYLDTGTYVKSFYSVMYAPSCVYVASLRDPRAGGGHAAGARAARIHHRVRWNAAAPLILPERYRRTAGAASPVPRERGA